MRLNIRTKNGYAYYSIIKDYTNIKGKRTTKTFEKLGNTERVEERFGKNDTLNKIKEYIEELKNEDKDELLKRQYNPKKRIVPSVKKQFNIGYLFLKKLYEELNW